MKARYSHLSQLSSDPKLILEDMGLVQIRNPELDPSKAKGIVNKFTCIGVREGLGPLVVGCRDFLGAQR